MKAIERAKTAIILAEKEFDKYLNELAKYEVWHKLSWWKKLFTKKVNKPNFYHSNMVRVYSNNTMCIELRLYYCNGRRELTLAINELGNGYRLDIESMKVLPYLGKVNKDISDEARRILVEIRNQLAPLIVE